MALIQKIRIGRMFLIVAIVGMYASGATWQSTASASAQSGKAARNVTIIVSDLGIKQWKAGLNLFDDFHQLDNKALVPVANQAQILVPMPSDLAYPASQAGWLALYRNLSQHVQSAIAAGNSVVEIRLVENDTIFGYFSGERQLLVDRFAAASLQAIYGAKQDLVNSDISVTCIADVGSNGGRAFVDVIPTLAADGQNPVDWLNLISSRSSVGDTLEAARVLNNHLAIWDTHWDFPGGDVVSDFSNAEKIVEENPDISLFAVDPQLGPFQREYPPTAHIESMRSGRPPSLVSQYDPYSGVFLPSQPLDYQKMFTTQPVAVSAPVWNADPNATISENFVGAGHVNISRNSSTGYHAGPEQGNNVYGPDIFETAPANPEIIDPSAGLLKLRQAVQDLRQKLSSSQQALRQAQNDLQIEEQRDLENQTSTDGTFQIRIEVPPGWVPCTCPDQHPGAGIFVNGVQYHTPFLHCQ
jgi:hypothetical protein